MSDPFDLDAALASLDSTPAGDTPSDQVAAATAAPAEAAPAPAEAHGLLAELHARLARLEALALRNGWHI